MQKVNLIDVKEVNAHSGATSIEVRSEPKASCGSFNPGDAPLPMEDLVETREQLPIHSFIYLNTIPLEEVDDERYLKDRGYAFNYEKRRFEMPISTHYAVTDKVWKFMEMEKDAINDLKEQNATLSSEKNNAELKHRQSLRLIEKMELADSKRWSTKIKSFFDQFKIAEFFRL